MKRGRRKWRNGLMVAIRAINSAKGEGRLPFKKETLLERRDFLTFLPFGQIHKNGALLQLKPIFFFIPPRGRSAGKSRGKEIDNGIKPISILMPRLATCFGHFNSSSLDKMEARQRLIGFVISDG